MILYVEDVLKLIEEIAPHELAEPWDNPGLQVGALNQEIKIILFSLNPTIQSIKRAIKKKVDLLFTHHPLIFGSITKISTDFYPGDVVKEAVKNGISIITAHTNLDSAPGGLNDILAEILHLKEVEVLQETDTITGAGLGRIGILDNKMKLRDLLNHVKDIFNIKNIRIVASNLEDDLQKEINKVAVVGGSGGNLIPLASKKMADVFITGDINYHDALNALSYELILIDAGHFHTENTAYKRFSKKFDAMLKDKGFEVQVIFDDKEADPFHTVST